ncbi:hypothetical protein ACPC54_29795 [Kitasatospora sp. NPDC094028]
MRRGSAAQAVEPVADQAADRPGALHLRIVADAVEHRRHPAQTAVADTAGAGAAGDLAQSLLVTCWNLGIAVAAPAGGLLLDHGGPGALPWAALPLLAAALAVTAAARRHGFPPDGAGR